MMHITIAWIAFGLGTTLGFLMARSVEPMPRSLELERAGQEAART